MEYVNNLSNGTDTTVSTNFAKANGLSAVVLSSSKVFIAHCNGSTTLYGIVCTISGTTITPGTDTLIYDSYYNANYISAVALSSTQVFIAHNFGNRSMNLWAVVCTISGTTITPGTDGQITANTITGRISAVALSSTQVFIAHGYRFFLLIWNCMYNKWYNNNIWNRYINIVR